jgi:hypothetical protein
MATQIAPTADRQHSPEAAQFSLMQRQAALFATSPLIPASLRQGGPEQAMANCYIAMTIADRMGEDRMTVMQNIVIVHGTAGFKAQYMIARANASGKFRDGIDWEMTGQGKTRSATAFATLASTGRRVEITVDMAMAEAEGWAKNPKYKTMPDMMLRYRSGTFLVRMYAPEVMLGYQTAEEREDVSAAAMPTPTYAAPVTAQALLAQASEEDEDDGKTGPDDTQSGEADAMSEELEQALHHIGKAGSRSHVTGLVNDYRDRVDESEREALQDAAARRMGEIGGAA